MSKKTSCYNCAYRGTIAGSAHSKCNFDWLRNQTTHTPPKASQHGIDKGWYLFPFNFDPTWQQEDCQAYSEQEDPNMVSKEMDSPFATLLSIMGKRML